VLKYIVLMLTIIAGNNLLGFDLISYKYSKLFNSEIETSDKNGRTEFSGESLAYKASLPIVFKKHKLFFVNNFTYSNNSLKLRNESKDFETFEDFETLKYEIMMNKTFSSSLELTTMLSYSMDFPKLSLNSDFEDKYSGSLILSKKFGRNWNIGFGANYSRITGDDSLLPIIMLNYISGKHSMRMIPPVSMTYTYDYSDKTDIGLFGKLSGNKFEIFEKDGNEFEFKYSDWINGIFVKQEIMKNIFLLAEGGVTYGYRDVEVFMNDDSIYDGNSKTDYTLSFKLSYGIGRN